MDVGRHAVIAGLGWGGGYKSELILLNPHEEIIEGEITFFDRDGRPITLPKLESDAMLYRIEPGGVFRWLGESPSSLPDRTFAVIKSRGAAKMPLASAVVSLWKESLLLGQRVIPARSTTQNAWIPVDTWASLIRHGHSRMSFSIANAGTTPATLHFTLFDGNGKEAGFYEQILPAKSQREWTLAELFDIQKFRGTLRLWSDVAVALSAQRITRTLRDEDVESEIGYLDVASLNGKRNIELPQVLDGGSVATEIILINPTASDIDANLRFVTPDGEAKEIILR